MKLQTPKKEFNLIFLFSSTSVTKFSNLSNNQKAYVIQDACLILWTVIASQILKHFHMKMRNMRQETMLWYSKSNTKYFME